MQESLEFDRRGSPSCASCIVHRSPIPAPASPLSPSRVSSQIEAKIPKSLLMLTARIILQLTDQIRSLKLKRRRFEDGLVATRYPMGSQQSQRPDPTHTAAKSTGEESSTSCRPTWTRTPPRKSFAEDYGSPSLFIVAVDTEATRLQGIVVVLSTMEEAANHSNNGDGKKDEAPQLSALLKEMKQGLDTIRSKIQSLTVKVKQNEYPTADGFSYLEAKNLLLLNYCQSLVYYLLRKAEGFSIEGHPVVQNIVEIRLFLEKIRPIDKKQQYQIQKLTKASENAKGNVTPSEEPVAPNKSEDVSKYRPHPDMLVSKLDDVFVDEAGDIVYRPVKFAPTSMELDKTAKQERNALRREKEFLRQAKQSDYIRSMMNDMEDRPEEVRDFMGTSREVERHVSKMEERARQEEELFTRVPLSKTERKRDKFLKKGRNGLQGLTESFYDEIKLLPFGDKSEEQMMGSSNDGRRKGGLKKRKRRH